MREETRQKLDHALRTERRQLQMGMGLAVLLGLAAMYVWTPWSVSSIGRAEGVVTYAKLDADAVMGRYVVELDVRLADGRLVRATGIAQAPPQIGSRVVLQTRSRWFWVDTYRWLAGVEPPPR